MTDVPSEATPARGAASTGTGAGKSGRAWIRVATVRGIGFFVDPLLFVLLGLVLVLEWGPATTGARLVLVLILLGSVLVHEIGHAWMARLRGLRVGGVFLHLLPFAYVERGDPKDEVRVALAGPAVSLLTFGLLLAVMAATDGVPAFTFDGLTASPLGIAAGVNLLMGTVNLLPVLPLDGGRALRAWLMAWQPDHRARRITARIGTFVGVGLGVVALALREMPTSAYVALLGAWLCVVAWREAAR